VTTFARPGLMIAPLMAYKAHGKYTVSTIASLISIVNILGALRSAIWDVRHGKSEGQRA